jgi:hypothetical protein
MRPAWEIVDEAVRAYRRNAQAFLLPALVFGVLMAPVFYVYVNAWIDVVTSGCRSGRALGRIGASIGVLLVLYFFYYLPMQARVAAIVRGRRIGDLAAAREGYAKTRTALAAFALWSLLLLASTPLLAVAAALTLGLAPYLAVRVASLIPPAILLDELRAAAAVRRVLSLVRRHFFTWLVSALLSGALASLLTYAIALLFTLPCAAIFFFVDAAEATTILASIFTFVLLFLVLLVRMPLSSFVWAILYARAAEAEP